MTVRSAASQCQEWSRAALYHSCCQEWSRAALSHSCCNLWDEHRLLVSLRESS